MVCECCRWSVSMPTWCFTGLRPSRFESSMWCTARGIYPGCLGVGSESEAAGRDEGREEVLLGKAGVLFLEVVVGGKVVWVELEEGVGEGGAVGDGGDELGEAVAGEGGHDEADEFLGGLV